MATNHSLVKMFPETSKLFSIVQTRMWLITLISFSDQFTLRTLAILLKIGYLNDMKRRYSIVVLLKKLSDTDSVQVLGLPQTILESDLLVSETLRLSTSSSASL